MANSTVHLTTAIPYVNAKPHLGHVLEWFQADAVARYHRLSGKDVSFTAGADENSLKNVLAAEKAGVTPQAWLDEYSDIFKQAYEFFDISLTGFRRGSDQELHWPGVQKLWQLCHHDMYKKSYEGMYCVGCESFYSSEDLIDGKCPEHLTVPELVKEENYFFKLSKYQSHIRELIASDKLTIVSSQFKNEMLGFINQGLEDFSVSRSITRGRGVGVPVPDDSSQVMYVWFDALAIYMTAIGWGYKEAEWQKFWNKQGEIIHVIGKGINRFHSVYWIGMLLSANLPLPTTISVHGYITANGQKMSKSLGNVIDPFELVDTYGVEPVRYYLLKEIPTHGDGDFSYEKFAEVYTSDLANGLGNLCSRVAKLCEKSGWQNNAEAASIDPQYQQFFADFELDLALKYVLQQIAEADGFLSLKKPWALEGKEQHQVLSTAVTKILAISQQLQPFMPTTASSIQEHFSQSSISSLKPLFPRLS